MTKIYDISPTLCEAIAVWPGDQPFSRSWACQIKQGDNIDLSSISTTVHVGAHADAPSHYSSQGASIEALDLDPFLGPCQVISGPTTGLISVSDCKKRITRGTKRVLFKTRLIHEPTVFPEDFTAFDWRALEYLGSEGISLVGIDTPSVDPFESDELPSHQQLLKFDMRNLEGLNLSAVPEGFYELIALPLKIKGADASPVRAILRERQ